MAPLRPHPPTRARAAAALATLLPLLLATGCQSLAVRSPSAQVQRLELVDRSAVGQRLEVDVVVTNPNDIPLRLWGVDYRLEMADGRRASFEMTDHPPVTLPPRGEQTIVLPAAVRRPGEADGVASVHGRVIYDAPGHIRARLTDLGVPRRSVRFAAQGE